MEHIQIIPAEEALIRSYWETLTGVMMEKRFLSMHEPFTLEQSETFIRDGIEKGFPYFFLVNDSQEVVGWCDIGKSDQREDVGFLGIGLKRGYRNKGLGEKLLSFSLGKAKEFGFSSVELHVREKNLRARQLYKKLGFVEICRNLEGFEADGQIEDIVRMRLEWKDE